MQGQTPEQQVMYGLEKAFEDAAGDAALTPFQKLAIMRGVIGQMQVYAAKTFQEKPETAALVAEYIVCFLSEHIRNSKLLSEVFEPVGEGAMHALLQNEVDALFDKYADTEDHLNFRH